MARKVLITGASGNVAAGVLPQLIKEGVEVKAYVRDAAKGEKLKALGAEPVMGDFLDGAKLEAASKGMDAVISITPPGPTAAEQASAITQAAKRAGVSHIIRLSAVGAAADAPTDNGKLHYKTDAEIIESGIPYTILRPNFFMQNLLMSVPTIQAQGSMYWGMGEGSIGLIDVRDIADSLAALGAFGGHHGQIYVQTGSESLTFAEMAEIISEAIGKPVKYTAIPVEAVGEAIRGFGMGDWFAQVMMDYSRAYARGWGDFVNGNVEAITGNPARSFSQFVKEVMAPAFK
ncbi:MAG: regulator of k+ conductance [Fibrobacteres bacterium]|nr:regulator of k+ conductance [Fibrobacterota bacterium]